MSGRRLPLWTMLCAAHFAAAGASAQADLRGATDTSAEISVYLVTIGQGDPYWTRFGHNALWIRDRERGTEIAYNWGLFDFNEPGFLARFLSGNTRYSMAGFDANEMLAVYRSENRSIDVQQLALPQEQARALRDFAEWNALPENRAYRYDYYRDNCSTRIRDALDRVLDGQIRAATDTIRTTHSYRWHTQRLLAQHASTYAGIMLVLGHPADRPITAWDEMFIPMDMRDHLRRVQVEDGSGRRVPLIQNEIRLFDATRAPESAAPPATRRPYTFFGVIGALLIIMFTRRATAASPTPGARAGALILTTAWSVLAGVAGVATLGAWAFTHHVFMYHNENVLQVTPLSLGLVLLLPFLSRRRAGRAALILSGTIFGVSLLGFVAQLLPAFDQVNGEIIGVALPMHAATAYALWRLHNSTGRSEADG